MTTDPYNALWSLKGSKFTSSLLPRKPVSYRVNAPHSQEAFCSYLRRGVFLFSPPSHQLPPSLTGGSQWFLNAPLWTACGNFAAFKKMGCLVFCPYPRCRKICDLQKGQSIQSSYATTSSPYLELLGGKVKTMKKMLRLKKRNKLSKEGEWWGWRRWCRVKEWNRKHIYFLPPSLYSPPLLPLSCHCCVVFLRSNSK